MRLHVLPLKRAVKSRVSCLSQHSLCSADWAEGGCSVPGEWSGSDPDLHQRWESVLRSPRGE